MAVDSNLEQLDKILKAFNAETLTKEDFLAAFKKVTELVLRINKRQDKAIQDLEVLYAQLLSRVKNDNDTNLKDLKTRTNELFVGNRLNEMSDDQRTLFNSLKGDINTLIDRKLREMNSEIKSKAIRGPQGDKGDPGRAPLSTELKLAFAPTVEEFRKAWEDKVDHVMRTRGAPGPNANAVSIHIVSDQCDGANRRFTMPSARKIYKFEMSQHPFNLYQDTATEVHGFTAGRGSLLLNGGVPAPKRNQSAAIYYLK